MDVQYVTIHLASSQLFHTCQIMKPTHTHTQTYFLPCVKALVAALAWAYRKWPERMRAF